jgi:hypothetical protein
MATLREHVFIFMTSRWLFFFFFEWEIFQIKIVGKIKTHFTFSNFFSKIASFMRKCSKYGGTKEATEDNEGEARYILDK